MKPLLLVFIDGLKPESVAYMPFLDLFRTQRRIRTDLGYSPTCYASMLTGVYPNKHLHWFTWLYSPLNSPYKWLRKFKLDRLPDSVFIKYIFNKITNIHTHGIIPWQGVMSLQWWYLPIHAWHYFDLAVKKHWSESNFITGYPTVFDILRDNDIPYEIVGLDAVDLGQSSKAIEQYSFGDIKPFTYFFVGDVDGLSHHYGQGSRVVIEKLKRIDAILQEKYLSLQKRAGEVCFIAFSDHGHVRMNKYLSLKSVFSSHKESLGDFIHFIDANFARFWFRNEGEEARVRDVLMHLEDKGFIMTEDHFQKYHVDMPDNRYGDLIFYLDVPYMFTITPAIIQKKLGSRFLSLHGYLPDNLDCDGVFISNKEARGSLHMELVDIMPSVLDTLGIKMPDYVDGKVIWI